MENQDILICSSWNMENRMIRRYCLNSFTCTDCDKARIFHPNNPGHGPPTRKIYENRFPVLNQVTVKQLHLTREEVNNNIRFSCVCRVTDREFGHNIV